MLLIMVVPWIIICSNYILLWSFSADKWKVYDLTPNKTRIDFRAVDVSEKMRKIALDKILIEEYKVREEERKIQRSAKEIRAKLRKESRKVGI